MGTSIIGIYRGKERVNYLVFNFNVNVCLSLDVKIDDKFLKFYRSYCKDMYDSAMRNSNINNEYMSIAWKEIAKPYKEIESFSKEEIEKILIDKDNWTTESECVMEAAREYAAREYQDLLDKYSYDWEPEFTVEEEK